MADCTVRHPGVESPFSNLYGLALKYIIYRLLYIAIGKCQETHDHKFILKALEQKINFCVT